MGDTAGASQQRPMGDTTRPAGRRERPSSRGNSMQYTARRANRYTAAAGRYTLVCMSPIVRTDLALTKSWT
eukprot:5276986-Prymnesium_polylepis.1